MKKLILGFLIFSATMLAGCQVDKTALVDGYTFGDLSVTYCASTTEEERDALRGIVSGLAESYGLEVGVDYCAAFSALEDGYDVGDVTQVWCNAATDEMREQIATVFSKELDVAGIALSKTYCRVAGHVLPSTE